MKKMKKIFALLLAMAMVFGMSTGVFAQEVKATGGNGPATITVKNTTPDKEYYVKKIFDASADANGNIAYFMLDADGSRITSAEQMDSIYSSFSTFFDIDAAGNITKRSDVSDSDITSYVSSLGTIVPGTRVTANGDGFIKFTGLEYGYYGVHSTLGSAVTITSTNPNAEVIDKNQKASWDPDGGKKIVAAGENGQEILVSAKDLAIGDTVTYRLRINAVNYEKDGDNKQIKDYIISDDMPEGMTFDGITKVTVTESNGTVNDFTAVYKKGGSKEVTADADGRFSFEIPWAEEEGGVWTSKYTADSKIVVEYTAALNDKAAIAGTGNANKAKFKERFIDNEVSGDSPEEAARVYTTSLTIHKVDQDGNVLTGAEFTITGEALKTVVTSGDVYVKDTAGTYYLLKDGSYTATPPSDATSSRYASVDDKYTKKDKQTLDTTAANVKAAAFVDSEGKVVFEGLSAGTYTVSETAVPAGYNKIDDFVIQITQAVDADDSTKINYSASSQTQTVTVSDNKVSVTIQNQKGSVLPSTGGMGTTLFYVIGAALVIFAGVVLVTRRRMNGQ